MKGYVVLAVVFLLFIATKTEGIAVTNAVDGGPGCLRLIIPAATAGSTITFSKFIIR